MPSLTTKKTAKSKRATKPAIPEAVTAKDPGQEYDHLILGDRTSATETWRPPSLRALALGMFRMGLGEETVLAVLRVENDQSGYALSEKELKNIVENTVPLIAGDGYYIVDFFFNAAKLRNVGLGAVSYEGIPFGWNKLNIVCSHDVLSREHALETARKLLANRSESRVKIVDPFKGEPLPYENGKDLDDLITDFGATEVVRRIRSSSSQVWDSDQFKEQKRTSDRQERGPNLVPIGFSVGEDRVWGDRFVWDKTLPRGGVSLATGRAKNGKTTFALNLAVAVQNGAEFLGRRTTKGRVLIYAFEGSGYEIRRRLRELGGEDDQILVHADTRPDSIDAAIEWIMEGCVTTEPQLVIVDNLGKLLKGAVENINNDYLGIGEAIDRFIELARLAGPSILVSHHANGYGKALGSESIFGAVDCELRLQRTGKRNDSTRKQIMLSSEQRIGVDFEPVMLQFDSDTGRVGLESPAVDANRPSMAGSRVLVALGRGGLTHTQLRKKVPQVNGTRLKEVLGQLVSSGEVVEVAGEKGGETMYELVDCDLIESLDTDLDTEALDTGLDTGIAVSPERVCV